MGEVLSQEEIDALLNSMNPSSGDDSADGDMLLSESMGLDNSGKPRRGDSKKGNKIGVPYDFRHPNKFLKEHMENIRMIFDDISKMWGAILTLKHRMVVQINMKSIDQMSYEEFLDISQLPTVYGIFTMIDGRSILGLDRNIAYIMMQNLFGGKNCEMKRQNRNLTDLENKIMAKLFDEILVNYSQSWGKVYEGKSVIDTVEANLHPLNLAPLNEIVIRVLMEVKMRDETGFISICIPYFCIQSVMDGILNLNKFVSEKDVEVSNQYQKVLAEKIRSTRVPVHVSLGDLDLTFADFLMLKRGDVVLLNTTVDEPLRVKIGNRVKFAAETAYKGKRMAAKIIKFHTPDD